MKKDKLISVIMPVYNRGDVISETLNSLIAQTYKAWECIVVDDGSPDNTLQVLEKFSQKDFRIRYYSRPINRKEGASACRNYGLEKSKGELIQFLDSDDLMAKNKLEEQLKICRGDYTLVTCKWGGFEDNTDLRGRFKFKYYSYRNFRKTPNLLKTFGKKDEFFPPHVYLTPKRLVDKAGWWNEDLTNNDDAEFFTRIILSAKSIRFTPNTAVYYRYSGSDKLSSITSEERAISAIKSWKLIETHILQDQESPALVYVENAKRFLKESIRNKFPKILEEERVFFESEDSPSPYIQILPKIKLLLKRRKFNRSK
jgi:glycosyltransferase involved in cell wall biosynthesis